MRENGGAAAARTTGIEASRRAASITSPVHLTRRTDTQDKNYVYLNFAYLSIELATAASYDDGDEDDDGATSARVRPTTMTATSEDDRRSASLIDVITTRERLDRE